RVTLARESWRGIAARDLRRLRGRSCQPAAEQYAERNEIAWDLQGKIDDRVQITQHCNARDRRELAAAFILGPHRGPAQNDQRSHGGDDDHKGYRQSHLDGDLEDRRVSQIPDAPAADLGAAERGKQVGECPCSGPEPGALANRLDTGFIDRPARMIEKSVAYDSAYLAQPTGHT